VGRPAEERKNNMDIYETILLNLGEIKGDLGEIKCKVAEISILVERIRRLELWQSWLKGGWASLATAFILRSLFGH
jgi:hypothetical protein